MSLCLLSPLYPKFSTVYIKIKTTYFKSPYTLRLFCWLFLILFLGSILINCVFLRGVAYLLDYAFFKYCCHGFRAYIFIRFTLEYGSTILIKEKKRLYWCQLWSKAFPPVVKWISQRSSEPLFQVRVLAGGHKSSSTWHAVLRTLWFTSPARTRKEGAAKPKRSRRDAW